MVTAVWRRGRQCLASMLLAAAIGWTLAPIVQAADPVTVFAAASLKNALDEVAAAYAEATGKVARASYAASSALAKQIEQGAPADLFFSADLDWMDHLDKAGLIRSGSRVNLLGNRLVLIGPSSDVARTVSIGPGFDPQSVLGDGRLAVGEVKSVPAGRYAKAALQSLGAWDAVAGRLAEVENVRAALTLVARGEAPAGIVYATDASAEPKVQVLSVFPEGSHPPIIYPVAVTASSQNPDATAFQSFLTGAAARRIFEKQGFTVLTAPAS